MARTIPLADSGIWLKREDEHELGAFILIDEATNDTVGAGMILTANA